MSKNNMKTTFYIVSAAVVIGGLFAWPIINDKNRPIVSEWKKAGIACLGPGAKVAKHEHADLTINVDGKQESFDRDLGIARGCMGEFHVHAGQPGVLHLETISATKEFKLSDFALIYGKPFLREGYKIEVILNGKSYEGDPAGLILDDQQVIELIYTSVGE